MLLALAGCASAVDGEGTTVSSARVSGFPSQPVRTDSLLPSASAGPSGVPTAPSSVPSTLPTGLPTSTAPASVTAPPSSAAPVDLDALLSPRPNGARSWSDSWGRLTHPSSGEFVKRFYAAGSRSDILSSLRSEGLGDIAHRTWIAKDRNQIDLILMQFRTPAGALNRYLAVTSATAGRTDVTPFAVGHYSRGEAQGFREHGHDSDGYVRARAYGLRLGGTVVLEAFFFSPATFARAEMVSWTGGQLARLG